MQGNQMGIKTSDAYLIYKVLTRARHMQSITLHRGEIQHADALMQKLWTYMMGCSPHAEAIEADQQAWTQLRLEEAESMGGHGS